jgi:hypothetical protein
MCLNGGTRVSVDPPRRRPGSSLVVVGTVVFDVDERMATCKVAFYLGGNPTPCSFFNLHIAQILQPCVFDPFVNFLTKLRTYFLRT